MSDDGAIVRERHQSLYFTDGNIVLLAQRPDKHEMLFRVHRSVLSSHSPVFSDMFDVCNPSGGASENEGDQFYDGVPLIRFPDNSDDIEAVLKILYYQSDLTCTPRSPLCPMLIMPILELSRKYGIDRMYAQIIKHLECDWPQTLKDWDKLERDVASVADDSDAGHFNDLLPEPAAAIKLAYQFDVPSILPAAFYHLSRHSILNDWKKTHADPSTPTQDQTDRTARWELLPARAFRCLLLGKAELGAFFYGLTYEGELRHTNTEPGLDLGECEVGEGLWESIMGQCVQSTDPLAGLEIFLEAADTQGCHTCAQSLETKIEATRAEIWGKLGDFFHLKDE